MKEDKTLKREIRNNRRLRKLGTRSPICIRCGESDPAALVREAEVIICYECQAKDQGRSPAEDHHLAGRKNDDFTIPLPGNDHRVASDLQSDWPEKTLRNPEGSPVLKYAARLRGLNDLLLVISERFVGEIPESLEELERLLEKRFGPGGWKRIYDEIPTKNENEEESTKDEKELSKVEGTEPSKHEK